MKVFWFLPTHGDSRYLGTSRGARTVSHHYLRQVAQAADATGVVVSGRPGNTGGAFAPAGAATSFSDVAGTVYTGVNFGDVPINRLDTDGQQAVAAGTTASYAHVFHAGSGGQLGLAVAPLTAVTLVLAMGKNLSCSSSM